SYFKYLEIDYEAEKEELHIPTFRQDLLSYADIAEEVARFYGYDNIPVTLPEGAAQAGGLSPKQTLEALARDVAQYMGFSESMTYSFESPKVFDKLMLKADDPMRSAIVISNPLGEDFSIMRTSVINGMLTSLSTNYNRRNTNVRLYELGNIYIPKSLPLTELPEERMQLAIGFYGEGDFYTMKGAVEEFFERAGLREKVHYNAGAKYPFLHPGRKAQIVYGGKNFGFIGEVHPLVCRAYDIKDRVYLANIDLSQVLPLMNFDVHYEELAKYPAATRDFSLVVPKKVTAGEIESVFERKGGAYLEHYELFDLYEGSQVLAGNKSMAYTLVFRAKDRSLAEEDITAATDRILKALEGLGVRLRQ
ncbi:MAG: phenylalanine--tRNA ligase subunit beta, partial [Lachnospiraceae bacterium]|nr:phenylalanine--tRNA ligase subunit beta [Lachnospiraceae bacterium]